MNTFDKSLIDSLYKEREGSYTSYIVDNRKVFIAVKVFDDKTLDLDRFYSRVDIKGLARCTLYFLLKELILSLPDINCNSLIEISIIAPSLPKRTMETIQKTYKNMGWSKIICQTSCALSPEEFRKMVKKHPYLKDSEDVLCEDTEICSALPEPLSKILDTLKFCEKNIKIEDICKPKKIKYTDEELTKDVPFDKIDSSKINLSDILNYTSSSDDDEDKSKIEKTFKKGGKNRKTRKTRKTRKIKIN
jgi:hypothetical protein